MEILRFTLLIRPSRDSSPIKTVSSRLTCLRYSFDMSIPIAIGKSYIEPSFFVSAGERFITILLLSSLSPLFFIAAFILSFDSFTLVSGKPN